MDNVCFRFIYFELSAIKPKPPRGFTGIEFAAFHPALIAPSHITRNGFALFLGEGGVDGGDELTAHIDGIDPFPLESDIDTQLFQFADILKAVFGVAGKAGDGLDKDLDDQAPTAVRHHPLEVISLSHRSSGDLLIRIDVDHAPFGLA